MTDKTARAAALEVNEKVARVGEELAVLRQSMRQSAAQYMEPQHKFNLLLEYLNAHEVQHPAVPAHVKIEKMKK